MKIGSLSERLNLRLSRKEKQELVMKASLARKSLTDYVREGIAFENRLCGKNVQGMTFDREDDREDVRQDKCSDNDYQKLVSALNHLKAARSLLTEVTDQPEGINNLDHYYKNILGRVIIPDLEYVVYGDENEEK